VVRVVWRHHPLYLKTFPLAEFWRECGDRTYVIELPDGSHTRIPAAWADDGEGPLPSAATAVTQLSSASVRELVTLLRRLADACEP
jgi:hypothetical protein